MLTFRVLGDLDLRSADGTEVQALLRQPKRLALFAYLLLGSARRYQRRDTLLGLFWPELDQEHARAALRRALYFLRRALGESVIATRGDEDVGIAEGTVRCDAIEFQEAVARGDGGEAHRLYRGGFLEGLYVAGAPDVEDWMDRERRRLAELLAGAAKADQRAAAGRPAPPHSPGSVSPPRGPLLLIIPFTIRADPAVSYLAEGLVELLATRLDGAGDLRVVEPQLVLAGEQSWDLGRALATAGRTGATTVALGTLVSAAGRLEATVALHRADGTVKARVEARADGEAELFDLVDELARRIVAEETGSEGDPLSRLAALSTESLPALKAFLSGARAFRLARHFEAADAFRRATQADASFALAWYRLASALAASALIEPAREASREAVRHADRLSPHDGALVEAQHAWLIGRGAEAESRYAALVTGWPESLEGWFLLGDVRVHSSPYHGRSIVQARTPFERALALDPGHLGAVIQLARLAAREGRLQDLDRLVDRATELSPAGDQALSLRALRAVAAGREGEEAGLIREIAGGRGLTIARTFADVALYGGDLEAAERLGRELFAAARSDEFKAFGHLTLAHLALARGRVVEAFDRVTEAARQDPEWGIETRGLFATFPFVPLEADRRRAIRDEIERWDPAEARQGVTIPLAFHTDLHAHLREFLLGLLAVRLGENERAAAHLEALAELDVPAWAVAPLQHLGRTLQAEQLRQRGDAAAALVVLEQGRLDVWFQYAVASPFFAGTFERFLRAELLIEAGRFPEALGWLGSIAERTPFELPFLAPALRLEAGIWRELGDPDRARNREARAAKLWEGASG